MAQRGVNTAANDDGEDGAESREQVQRVSWPVRTPARLRVPQNARVFVQGNFEADFGTGKDDDYNRGRNTRHELHPMGDRLGCMMPNLQVGRFYRFTFVIVHPDGREEVIRNHGESFNTKVSPREPQRQPDQQNPAEAPPLNRQSPDQTPDQQRQQAQVAGIQKTIDTGIKNVLEGTRTAETFEGFLFRLRRLQRDLEHVHHVSGDITRLMVSGVVRSIGSDHRYPKELRNVLSDRVHDFNDLERALEEGSLAYRESVFYKILFNDQARKFFKLDVDAEYNDHDPLGKAKFNKEFHEQCQARCMGFGRGMGGVLKESLGELARDPSVKPSLTPRLEGLMQNALEGMPHHEREGFLTRMLTHVGDKRKDMLVDALVKGGVFSLGLLGGGVPMAFGLSLGAAAVSGASGLRMVDVLRLRRDKGARQVGKLLLQNNVVVDAVTAKESAGKALGARFLETVLRGIPGVNLWYTGKKVGSHGMYKEEAPSVEDRGGASSFIKNACSEVLGQAPATAPPAVSPGSAPAAAHAPNTPNQLPHAA